MRLALIEWEDSAFAQGWMSREAVKCHIVSTCISVGLLVAENKKQITIIQSASMGKDQYGDGITIPRSCIKRVRYLKVK